MKIEEWREYLDYDPETGVFTWRVARPKGVKPGGIADTKKGDGYKRVNLRGHRVSAHRLAWAWVYGQWPDSDIDHINGDGSDNRICNLRLATSSQNHGNMKIYGNNSSGLKGISRTTNGKYKSEIMVAGGRQYLGTYETAEEAHEAYCGAALLFFGEFARVA